MEGGGGGREGEGECFLGQLGRFEPLNTPSAAFFGCVALLWCGRRYARAALGCINFASEADATHCATLAHLCVLQAYDRQATVREARVVKKRGWTVRAGLLPAAVARLCRGACKVVLFGAFPSAFPSAGVSACVSAVHGPSLAYGQSARMARLARHPALLVLRYGLFVLPHANWGAIGN